MVGHLQTLTEGTAIGSRLLTKEGDWDYGKLNHWYINYFLKEDGVSTGNQRPLDHARHEWQTAANAKLFYDNSKANLLMAGICVENGTPPFEILPHHLTMTEAQFTKCVLDHPPEIEYVSSKAHLAFSLDECKLLLATHDDTHRRAERTVRIGKDDDGECISAKSACALSGMGGSHASFEPVRPGFVFASESVDPAWMLNAPTAVVNGVRMKSWYMCNEKGSFTAEFFQDYLRYIESIKSADEWAVIFCDCVATHLSVENLNFMHVNKIKLTPRPPNMSDKIQNEDLWTFWLLRNNGEYGYNKVKQQRLHYVAMAEGRTSLNFEDAMHCIKIPWELCMNQANNQIAWRKGGLRPFSRLPQYLFLWQEMKQAAAAMASSASGGSGGGAVGAGTVMDATAQLHWKKMLDTAPATLKRRTRTADADDEDVQVPGDGEAGGKLNGRLGAAALFYTADADRGHLSALNQEIKEIKGLGKKDLVEYIAEIKKHKDPEKTFKVEYQTIAQAQLALIEWNGDQFNFAITDKMLGKKELIAEREKTTAASKRSDNRPSPTKAPAPAPAPKSRFWRMQEADELYGARTTSADSGAAAAGTAARA